MQYLIRSIFLAAFLLTGIGPGLFAAQKNEETEVRTQELVGNVVAVNLEASSFDLEYENDDPSHQKQVATFFITDISTIDIAMSQGNLSDLKPGLKVLVEFAPMPDGTNVVESVWVKKS
jgi:hypothetical protein